jgi:hypothetical protein
VSAHDPWWISALIGLLAMVPFSVQAALFLRNQRRDRRWLRTTAVVLDTTVSTTSDGVSSYRATYSYADPSGAARTGTGAVTERMSNGERLPILVDPETPGRSQPRRRVHVGHWVAGALGLLLFLVGIFGVAQGLHVLTTGRML